MKLTHKIKHLIIVGLIRRPWTLTKSWWRKNIWHKILAIVTTTVLIFFGSMYGIAQWYIQKHSNEPLIWGATLVPNYARYFGLDPKEVFRATIQDLGVKHLRLVSSWDDIEPNPGQYDFSELDWQFAYAKKHNVAVSLAIGLRQPRWPECHIPAWADKLPKSQWSVQLKTFMAQIINRYSGSPVLESYQLENEFFMSVFGECKDFDRQRLIDEYNFVKKLDTSRPVIISR